MFPEPIEPESSRILRWYAALEHLYAWIDEGLDAMAEPPGEETWAGPLRAAAKQLRLRSLSYHRGPPPSAVAPGQWCSPLPAIRAVSEQVLDCAGPKVQEVPLYTVLEHYLRVDTGRDAGCDAGQEGAAPRWLRQEITHLGAHLLRCMQMRWRLGLQQRSVAALYELLAAQALAVVLYDERSRPIFVNPAAARLQERYPELRLELDPWPVSVRARQDPAFLLFERFRQQSAFGQPARALSVVRGALHATLIPLFTSGQERVVAPGGPFFGLVLKERTCWEGRCEAPLANGLPEPAQALRERLLVHCGLTSAEARLAYGIYMGLSVPAYASLAGRSTQTVRKQLKSVFAKLGVHEQKSLVQRLWQEQRADWNRCVALLTAAHCPPSPRDNRVDGRLALVYPPPNGALTRTEALPKQDPLSAGHAAAGERVWDHGR